MKIKNSSRIFKYFRSSLLSLLFMTGICICLTGGWQKVAAQDCPPDQPGEINKDVTFCSLLNALKREALPIDKRNQALINVVQKRGIKFVLTEEDTVQFRNAGANDALIAAISKESEKIENTPAGNILLGKKYLDLAIKNQKLEDEARRNAKNSRYQKNDAEAQRFEDDAAKYLAESQRYAEKSIPYFNQAKLLEPDNSTEFSAAAFGNLAVAYGIMRDFDRAIGYATDAIGIDSTAANRYVNRALIYDDKARTISKTDEKWTVHEKALADCEKALELDPTNYTARQLRDQIKKLWGRN
jgi:tetratricopeptide (TPR) repeat protein